MTALQIQADTLKMLHDCENAVHDAFKIHCIDPAGLSRQLGYLSSRYGHEAVAAAMANCLRIAYLRNRFRP